MGDILGYARVSTGDQEVAGQTLRLEQAGAIRLFTDVKSGKSMDRPGLAELLRCARAGDTLAIVRLDRVAGGIAGNSQDASRAPDQPAQPRGTNRHQLGRRRAIFHVFGAIAHFDRRLISERTKDGIAAARVKRRKPGRQLLDMKKVEAAIKLIEAKTTPAEAAKLSLGRCTVYREMRRLGINRPA
ncbi:recombinase family protein [Mesorhizobium sp.]|uniref:recombinase family protein n=1 Tax=Mesorhizobium sp. TaxID=1871066 RepID=UPI0025FA4625|nr:recombinase family protein [Mesorhizobium sp.]